MNATISMSNLTKAYGDNVVVDQLDLEIEQGEFLVLLGPSGCGKTTTLRCIAGLETPQQGTISFGSADVFNAAESVNVPAHKRNIGMVFQSYALWPNMTVRKNIAYPLKVRKMKDALKSGRIEEAARMVNCEYLLDRYPSQLSGGQQQRIAVARGLAARPDLVLFDEPLSNLDAILRDQVRTEIHRLHEQLGFGAVFVTHDHAEAFALGDRLAIMKSGKIEQLDSPQDIFERPVSEYVADFIGMSNTLELTRTGSGWRTATGTALELEVPHHGDDRVNARIWPEDIALLSASDTAPEGEVVLDVELLSAEFAGRTYDVTVSAGSEQFRLRADAARHGSWLRHAKGDEKVRVSMRSHDMKFFPATSRED